MKRGLFLDRDGTLILDKHYLSDPNEVELISGAREFLKWAKDQGYFLFLFTNQSGVGRGYYTLDDVHACNKKMQDLLGLGDDIFEDICIATETPDEELVYRKPSGRYILEKVNQHSLTPSLSWCIGDKLSDLQAGINGGVKGVWVATGKPRDKELEDYANLHSLPLCETLSDVMRKIS